jgi:hypothetical protein
LKIGGPFEVTQARYKDGQNHVLNPKVCKNILRVLQFLIETELNMASCVYQLEDNGRLTTTVKICGCVDSTEYFPKDQASKKFVMDFIETFESIYGSQKVEEGFAEVPDPKSMHQALMGIKTPIGKLTALKIALVVTASGLTLEQAEQLLSQYSFFEEILSGLEMVLSGDPFDLVFS